MENSTLTPDWRPRNGPKSGNENTWERAGIKLREDTGAAPPKAIQCLSPQPVSRDNTVEASMTVWERQQAWGKAAIAAWSASGALRRAALTQRIPPSVLYQLDSVTKRHMSGIATHENPQT